jgi:hypothetical protein
MPGEKVESNNLFAKLKVKMRYWLKPDQCLYS